MVVITDEVGRVKLRFSASHDEASDDVFNSPYGVLEDIYIFVCSPTFQTAFASFSLF